tara:strand:- start:43585 stop:46104 length:2520 start_codon:yes stop_codon:yes gene_type:complete
MRCQGNARVCHPIRTPAQKERCLNNKDDDCDGQIDEASDCNILSTTSDIVDYAAFDDGELLLVQDKATPQITCYRSDGSLLRKTFALDAHTTTNEKIIFHGVWRQPSTKHIAALWTRHHTKTQQSELRLALYNTSCQRIQKPTLIVSSTIKNNHLSHLFHALHINTTGQIAIITNDGEDNTALRFFGTKGQVIAVFPLLNNTRTICGGPPRSNTLSNPGAFRLAFNSHGKGLISCTQRGPASAMYTRTFDLHSKNPQGTSFTLFTHHDFPIIEHALAVKDDGHTAIGINNTFRQTYTYFLAPDGTLLGSTDTGHPLPHRQSLFGDDVILHNDDPHDNRTVYLSRYSKKGTPIAHTAIPKGLMLRFSKKRAYGVHQRQIIRADGYLQTGAGLCQGALCHCQPYASRACSTFQDSYIAPCKQGRQLCHPDGSHWGACKGEYVPHAEICGNNFDDDCDGKIDESCANTETISFPRLDAYDIAENGDIAAAFVHGANRQVMGVCYRANMTVKRSLFRISDAHFQKIGGFTSLGVRLHIARKTGNFLVTWYEQIKNQPHIRMRLFDRHCQPLTPPLDQGYTYTNTAMRLEVAMDQQGNFATIGHTASALDIQQRPYQLNIYNEKAQAQRTLTFLPKQPCSNTSTLTLHPTNGTGWLLCRSQIRPTSLYMRRFDIQKGFIDKDFVELKINGAYAQRFHNTGVLLAKMNHQGDVVVTWMHREPNITTYGHMVAAFYTYSGKLKTFISYGPQHKKFTNNVNQNNLIDIPLLGDDFILQAGTLYDGTSTWLRYAPDGTQKSKVSYTFQTVASPIYRWRGSLRIANKHTYLLLTGPNEHHIKRDPLTFP